ncbi:MAG: class I SAM-dependent methyltransferase, partial [Actinomycetes bacterium]
MARGVAEAASTAPAVYRPSGSQEDLAPSGAKARTQANFAAIRVLHAIDRDHRPATAAEQDVLARWGSWGAVPDIFDVTKAGWADARTELASLIDQDAYSAASRTTMNAHYTDPALVTAIWNGLAEFGFTGGDVLEPGCGAGTFIGLAPKDARMIGVEWDPTTAKVAAALYPNATILSESFADTKIRSGSLDAAIGNVPYGDVILHDPRHNVGGHSIHNHFILKSLDLVRPGGFVAVLTSRYTMDATNPAARREMNAAADLVAAVRLPNNTHRRAAGTTVVSDLLVFQVREPSSEPADRSWESTRLVSIGDEQVRINNYFLDRPLMVLGTNTMRSGEYASRTLGVHTDDVSTIPARLAGALHGAALAAHTAPIFA